jgi:hypothetical protein
MLIVSVDWLKRDRPMRLLREIIPIVSKYPRTFDLLIVDEVHTCARQARGMRGQLCHPTVAAQQGQTTIQAMSYRAGRQAGTIGAFVILDFDEATDPAMVHVETLAG